MQKLKNNVLPWMPLTRNIVEFASSFSTDSYGVLNLEAFLT